MTENLISYQLYLLIDPRSQELEDISEEEEDDHTNQDIDSPLFETTLCLGIVATSK
jgi:hypothetical protein